MKNLRKRFSASMILLLIAAISMPFFDGIPFRIFYTAFSIVALIELFSFFVKKHKIYNYILAVIIATFLVIGTVFIWTASVPDFVTAIFSVCSYDVFAYLFGGMLGGLIFKKSHPFPHISKNKTWEGTIMGLLCSFILTCFNLLVFNSFNYVFFACGILALIGDLFESFTKRRFDIKDSNEIVIKSPIFAKIELLIGGSEGHGGYLDRIDSVAFTTTILWLLTNLL